jgi:hypothetical protein
MIPVAAWLLLATLPAQPAPPGTVENTEVIVSGARYDYSIELSERMDRLRDLTGESLTRRDRFFQAELDHVSRLAALEQTSFAVRARQAEIDARLAKGGPRYPVCTYAIDRSGAELLSSLGKASLDALALQVKGAPSAEILGLCQQATPAAGVGRAPCEWMVFGPKHPVCTSDTRVAPLCTWPDERTPTISPYGIGPDVSMLLVAARVARHPDWTDCDAITPEWLRQGCQAMVRHDASACPTWDLTHTDGLAWPLTSGPAGVADVDFALATVHDPRSATAVVYYDGRFHLTCGLVPAPGVPADALPTVDVFPSPGHPGRLTLAVPDRLPAVPIRASCRFRVPTPAEGAAAAPAP